jgi:hypothetical protein
MSNVPVSARALATLEVGIRVQQVSTLFCYEAHLLKKVVCAGGILWPAVELPEPAPFVILLGQAVERLEELVAPSAGATWTLQLREAIDAEDRRWLAAEGEFFSWPSTPCPTEEAGPLQQLAERWVDQLVDTVPNSRDWLHLGTEICRVTRQDTSAGSSGKVWRWAALARLKQLANQTGVPTRLLFPARVTGHALARRTTILELFAGWHHIEEGITRMRGEITSRSDEARHSRDFRSVRWFGHQYFFTPDQAACVKRLCEDWQNGTPEVGQDAILGRAGCKTTRLVDLFKQHEAWGTMIVSGTTKGSFRLQPPADATAFAEAADDEHPLA